MTPKRFVPFSDALYKANVDKNLCVTEKKKLGKYFVKNGKKNRQQWPQKQRLRVDFFLQLI